MKYYDFCQNNWIFAHDVKKIIQDNVEFAIESLIQPDFNCHNAKSKKIQHNFQTRAEF